MQTREQFYRAKQIASAPATPEKIHVYKTGANAGKTRKLNAKPARQGILPISEKTLWTWTREGKFPQPIRMGGNVTVWRASDVQKWIEQRASD